MSASRLPVQAPSSRMGWSSPTARRRVEGRHDDGCQRVSSATHTRSQPSAVQVVARERSRGCAVRRSRSARASRQAAVSVLA